MLAEAARLIDDRRARRGRRRHLGTRDLGGAASTSSFTAAVVERLTS